MEGGLELFCYGPLGFRLALDGENLHSCIRLVSEGGNISRDVWLTAIKTYISFLKEIKLE